MNVEQTDTCNGKAFPRQLGIAITYIILMIFSWFLLIVIQRLIIIGPFSMSESAVSNWFGNKFYLLLNMPLWLGILYLTLKDKFIIQHENSVHVTVDFLAPKTLEGGGTRFILYTTGFAIKGLFESKGFNAEIEKEKTCDSGSFTVSIKKISLEVEFMIMWIPLYERLSVFFQNGETMAEQEKILESIIAVAHEITEVIMASCNSAEEARMNQHLISSEVLKYIRKDAVKLGFDIRRFAFKKCDYPGDVQTLLNAGIEAETLIEIAGKLRGQGVTAEKAAELAAIYAKRDNVKSNRNITELVVPQNVTDALKDLGPIASAFMTAFSAQQSKNSQETPNKTKQGKKQSK